MDFLENQKLSEDQFQKKTLSQADSDHLTNKIFYQKLICTILYFVLNIANILLQS